MQSEKKSFKRVIAKFLVIVLMAGTIFGMMPAESVSAYTYTQQYGVSFCSFYGNGTTNSEGQVILQPTIHETQYVVAGRTATRPTNPTRAGYTFDNWYADSNCSSLFNFSTPINEPINVFGRWIKNVQFIAYDEASGAVGGGKVVINGSFPGTTATQISPSASFTQGLYDDYSYTFDYTEDRGYYFKGWSVNNPNNGPYNYVDYTTSVRALNNQYGEVQKIYAVFGRLGNETDTWTAYENKSSEFEKAYSVFGPGIVADGLYVLEDNNNITETHWEGLTADGKLPDSGNARFVIKLKNNVPLGSYNMVLIDRVSNDVIDVTLVVKHRVQKWLPVEPTCNTTGNLVHWECLECGKYFSDEACTQETTKAAMHLDALDHNYGDWQYLNATQHRHYCSHNNAHFETRNHTWNNGEITTQPTTTSTGIKTFTCTGCGATKTETVPKLNTPIIKMQPTDIIARKGETVYFEIDAEGEGLEYQWQLSTNGGKDWQNSIYKDKRCKVEVVERRNGYKYRCIVRETNGKSVTSDVATLTITNELLITAQPTDIVAEKGETVYFEIAVEGEGLKFQWQLSTNGGKDWQNSIYKDKKCKVEVVERRNGYKYRCIVMDANGNSVTSDVVTLTITPNLTIITQPIDIAAEQGEIVYFEVKAGGEGLKYQWQLSTNGGKDWQNSINKTNKCRVEVIKRRNGYKYRCIVKDKNNNSIVSDVVSLIVV